MNKPIMYPDYEESQYKTYEGFNTVELRTTMRVEREGKFYLLPVIQRLSTRYEKPNTSELMKLFLLTCYRIQLLWVPSEKDEVDTSTISEKERIQIS